ncbi:MAG: UDP-N-acetylmuramoyl-tripeptide--D-alanyl-D-alanine ligase [Pseudomonadota bacterium]
MTEALWGLDELIAAAMAEADGVAGDAFQGFSIDTRTLQAGDVFVALTDARDGHDFVEAAFNAGAAAAIVRRGYDRQPGDGLLVRVDDPLTALKRIGVAARQRLNDTACVIAVTGSAGKTTTKEMLRSAFHAVDLGSVHASERSYNNHWGVPLTLARLPRDTAFAVFEIGMNHANEIRPLTKMVQPHVAIVTTVGQAHVGNFADGEVGIAKAKAEIFEGLVDGGVAVIPEDNQHRDLLLDLARAALGEDGDVRSFGEGADATIAIVDIDVKPDRSLAQLGSGDARRAFEVSVPGRHNVGNAVAALIAVRSALDVRDGFDVDNTDAFDAAWAAFATVQLDPPGRGQVHPLRDGITLIDESYNANPASVRAALETIALYPEARRRVAVLGDMLELGEEGADMHARLADAVIEANIILFAAGPLMRHLVDTLPESLSGAWAENSEALLPHVLDALRPNDVVMVKGSLGSRMQPLTVAVKDRYAE